MVLSRQRTPWLAVVAAAGAVASLGAPWLRSGQVDYNTLDILRSASALDVVDGPQEAAVLALWFAVPLVAVVALLAAAWGRPQLVGWACVPLAPLLTIPALAIATSPFPLRWGAVVGSAVGVAATLVGGALARSRLDSRR